jgi:coproporphyrinogen III oxidase-like Fe-S oxidoreductase
MNLNRRQSLIKFDRQFPIYNFFFPAQGKSIVDDALADVLRCSQGHAQSRALYFHIPFCDTICNFCPFTRGKYHDRSVIDRYVESLLLEMRIKADLIDLKQVPVGAIFFGGGTPSLLDPEQILRIGAQIRSMFDLSRIREFSFEIEVKSLTPERAQAMREIGVTHPRFGLQTFSPRWREMFDLTATLEQIHAATGLLKEVFPYQTFDILYGMSGSTEEELIADLQAAVDMGTTNIDIYPIDNIMTQVGLHKRLKEAQMEPTTAMRKFGMNLLVDQFMRHAGFMPHNGHGYVRTPPTADVVSDAYSFVYHEHVYGYHDFDLLGFGTNAISSMRGHVVTNTHSRKVYSERLAEGKVACTVSEHDADLDYSRPVILHLPYHGELDKARVHWDRVHPETLAKLDALRGQGLLEEDATSWRLTKLGWYWYVNLMYYLMPAADQKALNALVVDQLKDGGRSFVKQELLYPVIPLKRAA